jgi:osmoprotectant transport system permease protein
VATGGSLVSGAILADGTGFTGVGKYLTTAANWWGSDGLLLHTRDHLIYTAIVMVLAALIALPIGLAVGHTGRGVFFVVGIANSLRAIPTLGLAVLVYVWLSPKIPVNKHQILFLSRGAVPAFIPIVIALILLAIPPILTNTYAGIQAVDPDARDAARGMGMRGGQVLWRVELPCALPLIMSGLRSATLQVIATVTVAAYLPLLGGLGRLIADGAQQNLAQGYPQMVGAGVLVAALAVLVDSLLTFVQRLVVSPGVSGRFDRLPGVIPEPSVGAQLTGS